jgi:hypothetical protein
MLFYAVEAAVFKSCVDDESLSPAKPCSECWEDADISTTFAFKAHSSDKVLASNRNSSLVADLRRCFAAEISLLTDKRLLEGSFKIMPSNDRIESVDPKDRCESARLESRLSIFLLDLISISVGGFRIGLFFPAND